MVVTEEKIREIGNIGVDRWGHGFAV